MHFDDARKKGDVIDCNVPHGPGRLAAPAALGAPSQRALCETLCWPGQGNQRGIQWRPRLDGLISERLVILCIRS